MLERDTFCVEFEVDYGIILYIGAWSGSAQ